MLSLEVKNKAELIVLSTLQKYPMTSDHTKWEKYFSESQLTKIMDYEDFESLVVDLRVVHRAIFLNANTTFAKKGGKLKIEYDDIKISDSMLEYFKGKA